VTQSDFEFDPNLLPAVATPTDSLDTTGIQSLLIALTIFAAWASSLFLLLSLDVSKLHFVWIVLAMLGQMFLYTGLFITAHDAMHGVVFPKNLKVNNWIGAIALWLYGLFSYKKLLQKHWQHHHHPASHLDPDFHDGNHKNFFAWYFHFMKGYWSWWPLLGLIAIYHSVHLILQIPEDYSFGLQFSAAFLLWNL
jgi:beta-carotene/zeaxanthin 4-ketolase